MGHRFLDHTKTLSILFLGYKYDLMIGEQVVDSRDHAAPAGSEKRWAQVVEATALPVHQIPHEFSDFASSFVLVLRDQRLTFDLGLATLV